MSDDMGAGEVLDSAGKVVGHFLWERDGGTVRLLGVPEDPAHVPGLTWPVP